MLRIISVCFALLSLVQAQTLQSIISHSLESHDSLKAIEQKLSAVDENLELSQNFQNPVISLSVGDIQRGDPLNRSIEPMQFTSINFQQKIPYFGKRGANASLINAQRDVIFGSLEEAKVSLVKEIKLTAYAIWEDEQKLRIVDEYIELSKKNIELSSVYSASGDSMHVEVMSMELMLSQLKIKRSRIKSDLVSHYARLAYLSSMDVDAVEVDVEVDEPKSLDEYLSTLVNNKNYQKKLLEVDEKNSELKVTELDSKADPFVSLGYFHREDFEDYINVTVGASLPIYGSESLKVQKARKEILEATFSSSDFYERLKAALAEAHSKLSSSYNIYIIITQESIPEVEHMFELTSAMLKNGKNLLLYTQLFEKKLTLYEQKVSAITSYRRSLANIEALLGETK